ncbi:MAG: LacI family DNA-binding transcriptional regulator [Clostridia bacterium]|nr:LacI family DNA-binding transcriptional regulator [Clostridia bacterium]
MRRPTLKDIAAQAGVSVTAVSRALNGYPDIGDDTRNHILELAHAMNYQPNITARSLVTQRSGVIGLFLLGREKGEGFSHPFSGQIINGMLDELTEYSYDLMVFNVNDAPEANEPSYIDLCKRRGVEGAFFMGLKLDDPWLPQIKTSPMPVVVLDMPLMGDMAFSVGCDNVSAAYAAVHHLLDLGHRLIGFINGHRRASVSFERSEGYQAALADYGVRFNPALSAEGDFTAGGAKAAFLSLINQNPEITAVFVASDIMAMGVLEAAAERGLCVPQDLSVVGFDNIEMSAMTAPPLTTMSQPRYELGQTVGEILVSACNGEMPPSRVLLKAQLVVRKSTCRPREVN